MTMRSAALLRLLRHLPGSEWAGVDRGKRVEGVSMEVFFTETGEIADFYIRPKQHGKRDLVRELTRGGVEA